MKLAFALMAAINAGFTKTEARRASWRPRSDSRFSLADSESGTAAIRPAWATEPGSAGQPQSATSTCARADIAYAGPLATIPHGCKHDRGGKRPSPLRPARLLDRR